MTMTNKLRTTLATGLLSLVAGCGNQEQEYEIVGSLTPSENRQPVSRVTDAGTVEVILPVEVISEVGRIRFIENARFPHYVAMGGGQYQGEAFDYNADGIFDKVQKTNNKDTYSISTLEHALHSTRAKLILFRH